MSKYCNAIVAGDVHGEFAPLQQLLRVARAKQKPLILLGDYVNRGPRSREVIDALCSADDERSTGQFVFLLGNHERELLKFLDGGPLEDFAAHGGLATIYSYLGDKVPDDPVAAFRELFDRRHRQFLESLPSFLETSEYLFSHTGFDPSDVYLRTNAAVVGRGNPRIFSHQGPWPKDRTFFGHFVQPDGHPYISPHLVCLDTGCGTIAGMPLTAFDLESNEVLQFEPESRVAN